MNEEFFAEILEACRRISLLAASEHVDLRSRRNLQTAHALVWRLCEETPEGQASRLAWNDARQTRQAA